MNVKKWPSVVNELAQHAKTPLTAGVRAMRSLLRWYTVGPLALGVWVFSGLFVVAHDEEAVVTRFGRFKRAVEPGIHYRLPYPMEAVERSRIRHLHRFEIGFRSTGERDSASNFRALGEESLMLTGDENIIDLKFVVQFIIDDPRAYLFNVADLEATIRDVSEAVMRQLVGRTSFSHVLTVGRADIQAAARQSIQEILEGYDAGLEVTAVQLLDVQPPEAVQSAFRDVVSAREESGRMEYEANGYAASLAQQAGGEAARAVQEAEAYSVRTVQEARGNAARFTATLSAYGQAKTITRQRLYLDTLQDILEGARKIVVEPGKSGVLQLLPLNPQAPDLKGTGLTGEEK